MIVARPRRALFTDSESVNPDHRDCATSVQTYDGSVLRVFRSMDIDRRSRDVVGRRQERTKRARSSGAHLLPKPLLDPCLYHSLIFRLPLLLSYGFQLFHERSHSRQFHILLIFASASAMRVKVYELVRRTS